LDLLSNGEIKIIDAANHAQITAMSGSPDTDMPKYIFRISADSTLISYEDGNTKNINNFNIAIALNPLPHVNIHVRLCWEWIAMKKAQPAAKVNIMIDTG
jgi:hypothetical protein